MALRVTRTSFSGLAKEGSKEFNQLGIAMHDGCGERAEADPDRMYRTNDPQSLEPIHPTPSGATSARLQLRFLGLRQHHQLPPVLNAPSRLNGLDWRDGIGPSSSLSTCPKGIGGAQPISPRTALFLADILGSA